MVEAGEDVLLQGILVHSCGIASHLQCTLAVVVVGVVAEVALVGHGKQTVVLRPMQNPVGIVDSRLVPDSHADKVPCSVPYQVIKSTGGVVDDEAGCVRFVVRIAVEIFHVLHPSRSHRLP